MSTRPTSSGGNRPLTTSSDGAEDRPTTSYRNPQYTYNSTIYEDEEDYSDGDESPVEDLFAFIAPTTMESQQAAQSAGHGGISSVETRQPADYSQVFGITLPPEQLTPISPPPQVYDPSSPYSPVSPRLPPNDNPTTTVQSQAATEKSIPLDSAPASPPSTASHNEISGSFRMRRLRTANSDALNSGTNPSRASAISSREHRLSLRPPADGIMELEYEDQSSWKHRGSSTAGSYETNVSPSMMDPSSREGSVKMGFDFDAIDEEDSPYPEVRASVSNIDDPDMPAMTIRMWIIGLGLCIISAGFNMFFTLRYPAPNVVPMALLLVAYPIGKFFAFAMPISTYRLPKWLGQYEFSLNPGPWSIKEHVLVYIMANVAISAPYAILFIITDEKSYGNPSSFGVNILLTLGTQMTGFGLAGMCQKYLVWPASMIWPQNLVACTLLNTLHAEVDEQQGGIGRYKYFVYVFCGAFFWYLIPGFFFKALSVFSFACWIAPNNVVVNQMLGVGTGLGMTFLTFDWTMIAYIGSPLVVPWWAECHVAFGFVLFYWILVPILYYTDVWSLSRFPMTGTNSFDRFGHVYNISKVVQNGVLDEEAYKAYSALYLPATFVMTYVLAFALSSAVLVHTALYHGRSLWEGIRKIRIEPDDIHAKLMRIYPAVPWWWYALSFVTFFCCVVVAVEVGHTGVPVWMMLISLLLPVVYILPSGFIYAMTNQGITLNLQAEIIPGVLLQGNPRANMIFKTYSVQTLIEATSFTQDLKLGHYVKVPPRATFIAQLVATFISAFVQIGVKHLIFAAVPDVCTIDQPAHLICPHNNAFFTASAVWGLIGPTRQFGVGKLYHPQLYAIVAGALIPIPFWLWQRRYPKSWVKYVSTPVILNGVNYIPPAYGINYSSWFLCGFIFQFLIRRYRFAWWSKFNYVTSAALEIGTVVSVIFIFLTLQLPDHDLGDKINWWGNNVFEKTLDRPGNPKYSYRPILPGEPLPLNT